MLKDGVQIKKILGIFRKWLRKLSPPLPVGGLRIGDSVIQFFEYKGEDVIQTALRLPPGVIEGGKIKDKERLTAALEELRRRLAKRVRGKLYVVLTLPVSEVYIQPFTLPPVASAALAEAAELNLRMISPIGVEEAYYGWQEIGNRGEQPVLLGAFIRREIVDTLTDALQTAGFGIAAVEFTSLSLARYIKKAGAVGGAERYMAVEITSEGVNFIVVQNDTPQFHYFHPWGEVQRGERVISVDSFKKMLEEEMRRILNFYTTHWVGQKLVDVLVITPALSEEVESVFKRTFPELALSIRRPEEANAAAGAALRGTLDRSSDTDISLAGATALQIFQEEHLLHFVRLWRNALLATAGFVLILFVASSVFVRRAATSAVAEGTVVFSQPGALELQRLVEEAAGFNNEVAALQSVVGESENLYPLIAAISGLAGRDITLTRLAFNLEKRSVAVNGLAPDEASAVAFKDRLRGDGRFSGVDLPIRNVSISGNQVSFIMDFQAESLEF